MTMRKEEFDVLYEAHSRGNGGLPVQGAGLPAEEAEKITDRLEAKGWLEKGVVTPSGCHQMEPYRVDNAIIMAAGFGLRSLPLSRYVPKGLYMVCGEVLIERQIRQLQEAGVGEIVVVVGYLKEKFAYLAEKYGVILVDNPDYYRYNNISSLYAARDYLKNSYICCSDNYFSENVFHDYVYDSYYSCKYAEGYADEYCVTKTDGDYITQICKGGSDAWYTIGEAYFSRKFSNTFLEYLEAEYENTDTKKMLWDDFHMKHIDELPIRLVKYSDETVQEFDTVEDVIAFDAEFASYRDRILREEGEKSPVLPDALHKYEDVKRYNSATTDSHEGRLHLNENTFGPSRKCLEILKNVTAQDLYEYDMASEDFLVKEISQAFSMPEDDIYIHNGSAEIIKSLFSVALERGDHVLVSDPGWSYYASLAEEKFCGTHTYRVLKDDYSYYVDMKDLLAKASRYKPRIIVVTSPHNPTGCILDEASIERIIRENPDSIVLLDQAYWGFSEESVDVRRLVEAYSNLIVSRTFSKYFGLADIRIGYGFCNAKVKHIYGLDLPLFRASTVSRRIAAAALHDREYYEAMCRELCGVREWFTDELNRIDGIHAFRSGSNFVAVRMDGVDMEHVKEALKQQGVMIRLFEDHGEMLARIAVSNRGMMEKVVKLLRQAANQ